MVLCTRYRIRIDFERNVCNSKIVLKVGMISTILCWRYRFTSSRETVLYLPMKKSASLQLMQCTNYGSMDWLALAVLSQSFIFVPRTTVRNVQNYVAPQPVDIVGITHDWWLLNHRCNPFASYFPPALWSGMKNDNRVHKVKINSVRIKFKTSGKR